MATLTDAENAHFLALGEVILYFEHLQRQLAALKATRGAASGMNSGIVALRQLRDAFQLEALRNTTPQRASA